ncbi:Uncharacterized conserved protein [Janthinobacterium sp. Marseille]|nr:hypothetical protein [Janthinobacterium sp. Marseille]ABR90977.1 Uncharacterized conserved protein [Janthinobacterium sp. Marseille]
MENAVYNKALAALKTQFGMPRPLGGQNGARFLRNGTITIYHTELAPGNLAEITFNVQPISSSYGISPANLNSLLDELRHLTGRPTEVNKLQNWPRIGLATEEDVTLVMDKLAAVLKK